MVAEKRPFENNNKGRQTLKILNAHSEFSAYLTIIQSIFERSISGQLKLQMVYFQTILNIRKTAIRRDGRSPDKLISCSLVST